MEVLRRCSTVLAWRRYLAATTEFLKPDSTILLAIAFAVCLLFAFAAWAENASEIRSAVVELDRAYPEEDVSKIQRRQMPDHLSFTALYGGAAAVDAQVEALKDLERQSLNSSASEIEFLTPGIALVNFERLYKQSNKGRPLPARISVSEVWLTHRDGSWLQRLYQETAIAEE